MLDQPAVQIERYEWIGRDNTKEYMDSIHKWKIHSNSSSFSKSFDAITDRYKEDNELRTIKIEEFLIQEAQKAGVIRTFATKM